MEIFDIHNTPLFVVQESYDAWIHYQEYAETVTEEEKQKHKYVIYEDFPTAESWLIHKKKRMEADKKRYAEHAKYMKLPWYEKLLTEDGTCKIKDQLIGAFINNKDGEKIRLNLCVWNITPDILFNAIKHFAPYITDRKFTDEEITAFLNRNSDEIKAMGAGVAGDGGRVLRTLKWVCTLFYKEMV
jgi:hypothetical protein